MITMFFLVCCIACSIMLHIEDKNRRSGAIKGPTWTNLVFKLWSVGSGVFLSASFMLEDGEWLISWLTGHNTAELNAIFCATIITLWMSVVYIMFTYLAIIPDDDEDMGIIADAIYYDGE